LYAACTVPSISSATDNGGEHDLDVSEPIAGLFPALGTDRLMHGQAGGGFVLAHDLAPVMSSVCKHPARTAVIVQAASSSGGFS
jgi:hypothetical protein